MESSEDRRGRALRIAVHLAKKLRLRCDDVKVLRDSNNTVVHLAPSPIVAKIGTSTLRPNARSLSTELLVARHIAERGGPIAPPADEVPAGPHHVDGTVVTLWAYVTPNADVRVSDADLGHVLRRFHSAIADYPSGLPDFTENLERVRTALENHGATRSLVDPDRKFLMNVLSHIEREVARTEISRYPLHGDPHLDGNVIITDRGPLLVDFEGCCRGPYEWDLTSLARAVRAYPETDAALLGLLSEMRSLCVATSCWSQYGRSAEVDEAAHVHLRLLRGRSSDD